MPYSLFYIFAINIVPNYRHIVHWYYVKKRVVFVSMRIGKAQSYVHVSLRCKSFGYAVACSSESAKDVGRKLPTEH